MPDKGPSPFPSMDRISFGIAGVHKLLTQLKPRKAVGPDNISPALLKMAADELAPILTRFFQFSYDSLW